MRPQIQKTSFRILRKLGERRAEPCGSLKSLVEHDVVDRHGKQRVGFVPKVGDAIPNRGIYDGAVVEPIRDGLIVALEEVLVQAVVFIEESQGRFQALCESINRGVIETLVVDSADFKDQAQFPTLGEKDVRANESVEIDLLRERAGFVVVLK